MTCKKQIKMNIEICSFFCKVLCKYKKSIKIVFTLYKKYAIIKISKEDMRMKKLKLRNWVKVVLAIGIVLIVLVMENNQTNKDIQNCISAGHSQAMCENGLR